MSKARRPTQAPEGRQTAEHSQVHASRPELAGAWDERAYLEVLKRVEASRAVCYLLVSDGITERCIFFPVGGLRLTSTGRRRGTPLRQAIQRHPAMTPERLRELEMAQISGEATSLEEALGGPLRKIAQECSQRIVFDELTDMIAWSGAEFEYRSTNPPPAIFEAEYEAIKMSLGVPKLLAEVRSRIGDWQKIAGKLGNLAKTRARLGPRPLPPARIKAVEKALFGAIQAGGPEGAPLEDLILAGRRAGRNAVGTCQTVLKLGEAGAVALDVTPPAESEERRKRRARSRIQMTEDAIEQFINQLVARRALAAQYQEIGDVEGAMHNLQLVGEELRRRQDHEGAIAAYQQIVGISPMAFFAREQMAQLYEAMKRGPEAVREWLGLARAFAKHRLYNRAQDKLRRAIRLEPQNPNLRRMLIDALRAMGKNQAAAKEYQELARLYELQGRHDEALACYQQIATLQPDDEQARARMQEALRKGASFLIHYLGLAAAALVVAGLGYFVFSRYQARQAFEAAREQAVAQARAKQFDAAYRTLEDFQTLHAYDEEPVERVRGGIRTLADYEAKRLFRQARQREDAQEMQAARAAYQEVRRRFPESEWARQAGERLSALDELGEAAARLANEVAGLSEAGQVSRALVKGRELLERYPWSVPAQSLELPLAVESSPPDASVDVDGRRQSGRTPLVLRHPAAQPFKLRVSLSEHEAATRQVDLRDPALGSPVQVELRRRLRFPGFETLGPLVRAPEVGAGYLLVAGTDQRVYRLDEAGRTRWVHRLPPFAEPSGAPLRAAGVVVVTTRTGRVWGLSYEDGSLLWSRELEGAGLRPVASFEGERVVVCTESKVRSLSAESGEDRWIRPLPGPLARGLQVKGAQGHLLGLTRNGWLVVLREKTGKLSRLKVKGRPVGDAIPAPGGCLVATEDGLLSLRWQEAKWSTQLPEPPERAPLVADERVYIPCGRRLLVLSLDTGQEAWHLDFEAPILTPGYQNGRLYVASQDGTLHALAASNGKARWSYRTGVELEASPVVRNDTVYLASTDFTLYAIADD